MTTLRDLLKLCGRQGLIAHAERLEPRTYEELISRLNSDLDVLVGFMESDSPDFATADEDRISRELVRLLKARCYEASHETDHGGHVDVTVKSSDGRFSWLAEAKILDSRGNAWLDQGMDQLVKKYSTGTPGHNNGGLLVYIKVDRPGEKFKAWRDYHAAQTAKYERLSISDCSGRHGLAFFSEFVHPSMGNGPPKYSVRHLAVALYRAGPSLKVPVATGGTVRAAKAKATSSKMSKPSQSGKTKSGTLKLSKP